MRKVRCRGLGGRSRGGGAMIEQLVATFGRRMFTSKCSAICARRGADQRTRSSISRIRAAAAARDEWRALRGSRPARGARCLHLRAASHASRCRGRLLSANDERHLKSRRRDGAALRDLPEAIENTRAARGAARILAGESRLRISRATRCRTARRWMHFCAR